MYDPGLGRFLQTDPIGYRDDQNLYAYVYNDPLNGTDPTGTFRLAGAGFGGVLELVFQAAENVAGLRQGYSLGDVGIAAAAGATGVGAARLIGCSAELGQIGETLANVAADAAVSALTHFAKDGQVSGAAVPADVAVGAAVGGPIGDREAVAAGRSPEGRVLERQADRAARIASQSDRPARQTAAAQADAAQRDYSARAGAVAGATAANAERARQRRLQGVTMNRALARNVIALAALFIAASWMTTPKVGALVVLCVIAGYLNEFHLVRSLIRRSRGEQTARRDWVLAASAIGLTVALVAQGQWIPVALTTLMYLLADAIFLRFR